MPARFRKLLDVESEDTFVVVKGFDHCISVYPLAEWERKEAVLREQAITNSRTRKVVRTLMASATETPCDWQGRILIPPPLIAWARRARSARAVEPRGVRRLHRRHRGDLRGTGRRSDSVNEATTIPPAARGGRSI